jgi:F420-non-reducing hydrogenase iron-sulfur subunit
MSTFEPNIVGFLCNWCSYAGADLAGVSRIQYSTNMRVIKVMCSGRVEPGMVLKLLEAGADGVMVTGCHIGDCHYISGNLHTKRKFVLLQKLLAKTGLEPQRIRLEWNSAAEGQRFANLVNEFTEQVRAVGPSPLRASTLDAAKLLNTRAALAAADGFRLRALVGKEEKLVTEGNVYGDKVAQDEFTKVMDEAVETEFQVHRIHIMLQERPRSVNDIAKQLGMQPRAVLSYVVALRQRGWVDITETVEGTPLYAAQ